MEEESEISCFLCKTQDAECISISYRDDKNSFKEDLTELYGDAIEHYLSNDDPVCLNCAQIIDNTVRLKRQVYEVIVDNAVNMEVFGKPGNKSFNFANIWTMRTNDSFLYPQVDNLDLLMITGSIPTDERCDPIGSRNRYGSETPFLDREVQRATSRSRRRGHKWTRRKSSNSRSAASRSASRYSHSSRTTATSTTSRASTRKKKVQTSLERQLKGIVGDFFYQSESLNRFTREYLKKFVSNGDDCFEEVELSSISGASVKTRFASVIRDKLLSEYQQLIYECPYDSCQEVLYTLEKITEHRVQMHNEMAMFWCEQCKFYYLTQEHLDKHSEVHFQKFIAYCIYCSEEYTNKVLYEKHLDEHLLHSFPCIYCDKFFLRKQICENHVRIHHPGKKKKIKRIKPQSILDRIDKKSVPSNERKGEGDQKFEVRILWQHGQPEATPRVNEDELEDVDLIL
ncbi:hypothetical protein FQR65_LT10679 [Abscondita terminalis]|nr:hypothetical protein FQR65_LT10679 [Abscondita terminalis]